VAFNENTRVKIPALIHLQKLGYGCLSLKTLRYDPETNVAVDILAERMRINTRFSNKNFKKFINITQCMIFSNNMEYDEGGSNTLQGELYRRNTLGVSSWLERSLNE
jgi:hypothetical protein